MSAQGVVIRGPLNSSYARLLSPEALAFVASLHREFEQTRRSLLLARVERQKRLDAGEQPGFLSETKHIREGNWKGPSIPKDLADRRVEITGPVDRKMIINALNSGAKVFMADFEDSSAPTWEAMMDGQLNLYDAVRKTISFTNAKGKHYKLREKTATLMVRPRGWHLTEDHILVDGEPLSAALCDFGLFFFHNAKELLRRGSGPYFYLAKLENHKEAKLWNDVFVAAQAALGVPRGTIRATVLLETILAAFEMDEILYELRDHSAGLNCGRWDYIFSFIKKFGTRSNLLLPDRAQVGMNKPFMANYTRLVVQTCHKRGVHAMGGMAANIPSKTDKAANDAAFAKVRADKLREVRAGHDGSWVAHPGLIHIGMEVFDKHMPTPNQIHGTFDQTPVTAADLMDIGTGGSITDAGMRANISVGICYLEAWLRGVGCVPLHNKMEDAATAEISRCQIWQWLKHGAKMDDGRVITRDLVLQYFDEEVEVLRRQFGPWEYKNRKFELASKIYEDMMFANHLPDFLTTAAYPFITTFVEPTLDVALRQAKL